MGRSADSARAQRISTSSCATPSSSGCREFDFTIGDEPYKRDWCDAELKLYDHRSAVTLRGWLAALPSIGFTYVKRVIKQTPFLWRLFVKARAVLGRTPPPVRQDTEKDAEDGA